MSDFEYGQIEVRYNSSSWGPFIFDFTDSIPSGTTISTVVVRSFLDKVDPGEDLPTDKESTSYLVDGNKSTVIGDAMIAVYLNYPGSDREGNHTLLFEVTLNNGGTHPFYFWKVVAK